MLCWCSAILWRADNHSEQSVILDKLTSLESTHDARWPNIVIKPHRIHECMHGWLWEGHGLACAYERGPVNFCKGLESGEALEGAAHPRVVAVREVLDSARASGALARRVKWSGVVKKRQRAAALQDAGASFGRAGRAGCLQHAGCASGRPSGALGGRHISRGPLSCHQNQSATCTTLVTPKLSGCTA